MASVHVWEERIGTYGFRTLKHALVFPGIYARDGMRTSCGRLSNATAQVVVCNRITLDRTWCRSCARKVTAEVKELATRDRRVTVTQSNVSPIW